MVNNVLFIQLYICWMRHHQRIMGVEAEPEAEVEVENLH